MAFWGIGKLKEYGGMLNLKDVQSKIKTYVNQPQQESITLEESNITTRSTEELFKIQLQEYQKLMGLQKQILAEIEDQRKREFEQKQAVLMKKLQQMQQIRQKQKKEQAVMELTRKIESGQKDLKSIILENTLLREQVVKNSKEENELS